MAKKQVKIPERHQGIPRTHTIARKLGYKKSKHKFADLSDESKSHFIQLADYGSRPGSLCGVAPSNDPGYWLVCYKDPQGNCNWVSVPRGSAPSDHG